MLRYRWFVGLEGHEFDLEALAEFLASGSIRVIREDDGQWYLSGAVFEELEDSSSVRDRGIEVAEILNGAGVLFGLEKIRVSSNVLEVTDVGVRKNVVVAVGTLRVRRRVKAVVFGSDGKPKENENALSFRRILELARTDQRVWDALHFISQQQNWTNLYKVFEVVRDDVGDRVYNLVDGRKLQTFKGTAQSRRLLGDEARHASEKIAGPSNPISLAEAKQLIRLLVENWLQEHKSAG